ncbi:rod shape-determining protein MreC [Leptobacterium sp. I13]|uniref:rod shape-determining protein MreC n=1 Tax=Leptobacterium meishanense TaxID=3128904 RepID=UPI0030EC1368
MLNIISFFIRNRNFFLFIFLLSLSLVFTFQSHSYHKSKFITSANWFTGSIYNSVNNVYAYFDLKETNQTLIEENKRLRSLLINNDTFSDSINTPKAFSPHLYNVKTATVIHNSYAKTKNYITIDKGEKDSIKQDMGVITSKGIVGIVDNTSKNYAVIQSVLNSLSEINAQLQNTSHFGTLKWNGKDHTIVQLTDIPSLAPVKVGDTIITGGMSTIFPKGILIGTIQDFNPDISENYYTINVKLFNDMTNISYVYIIENKHTDEIKKLEAYSNEE